MSPNIVQVSVGQVGKIMLLTEWQTKFLRPPSKCPSSLSIRGFLGERGKIEAKKGESSLGRPDTQAIIANN